MLAGYEPAAAIELIREQRSPAVLSNNDFVRWLMSEAAEMLTSGEASDWVAA